MKYLVFNRTRIVNIKDELVALYEEKVSHVDNHRIEYLVASSDFNENSKDLDIVVEQAIVEEIGTFENIPRILKKCKVLEKII